MQLPQSIILSTDVMQLTLTRKMTTAQVVKMSVTVNDNSPIQDYVHPHDHTQPSYEGSSNTYIYSILLFLKNWDQCRLH